MDPPPRWTPPLGGPPRWAHWVASHTALRASEPFQEQEMEVRKQAFDEERRRREDLEKRLQEETSRRQKLIDREVKLREKQRAQVGERERETLC